MHKFSIPIKSDEFDPETEEGLKCDLVFTYTPKYPEEAPCIEIDGAINFEDNYESELIEHLNEQVIKFLILFNKLYVISY